MKILILSTSSNNTDTVIGSLNSLDQHELVTVRYDKKFHAEVAAVGQQNPDLRNAILVHQWPPQGTPEQAAWLKRVSCDQEMLDAAKYLKPDVILYISAWTGDFVPAHETLGTLNTLAPVVHMCFDGADPPWWDQMKVFEEKGLFSLTVNIDGSHEWPGGKKNQSSFPNLKNALTLLTPLDPRPFAGVQVPFSARPFPIAYAGNSGEWIRSCLVQRLQQEVPGFAFKQRDDQAASYKHFCDFLRHSKVVVSVGFTGSNATMHVKGRVLEAGYAGTALLEWRNPATREWFTPRYEYEEYDSVEEGIDMAKFLVAHPTRCKELAAALHHRVITEHSARVFWGKVFAKLGK